MKYLKQLTIIFVICLVAEAMARLLPFQFPGNILAMLILGILLMIKVVREEHIKETSDFLLELIGLFIVPVTVSVIDQMDVIREIGLQLLIICLILMVLVFASCAFTIRLTMKLLGIKKEGA